MKTKPTITLIDPPALKLVCTTKTGERFTLPTVRTHFPKQQLLVLSSATRILPCELNIVDMKMEGNEEVPYATFEQGGLRYECLRVGSSFGSVQRISESSDVVGITSPFTQQARIVTDLAKYIRKINPNIKLVVGGYDTVTDDRQNYYLNNGFDHVIPNEGEIKFPHWIASQFGLRLESKSPSTNTLYDQRRPAKNLILPLPDLSNFDYKKYIEAEDGQLPDGARPPIGYFVSSRGCDRACEFCTIWSVNRGLYNVMTPDQVAVLLQHYKTHGVTTLLHAESNLLTRLRYGREGRKNLIDTIQLMREGGFAWEFFDGIEFGRLTDEKNNVDNELVKLLFSPRLSDGQLTGGYRAYVPLEAISEPRTKTFDKLKPIVVQNKIIQAIVETGVKQLSFGLIIGFPEETTRTVDETKRRADELRNLVYGASGGKTEVLFIYYVHSLFPGSLDYKKFRSALTVNIEKSPELFQLYTACKTSAGFSESEMTLLRRNLDREYNGNAVADYSERTGRAPTLHPVTTA